MSDLNLRYTKEIDYIFNGATAGYVNRGIITEIGNYENVRFAGHLTIEQTVTCSDHGGEDWDTLKKLLNEEVLGYLNSEILIRQEWFSFCIHTYMMSRPELIVSYMGGRVKAYIMRRGSYCWIYAGYWPNVKPTFDEMLETEILNRRKKLCDLMRKNHPDFLNELFKLGDLNLKLHSWDKEFVKDIESI